MSDMNRQSAIFGKRSEPHTIIIAHGDDLRHFTIRPWLAASLGTVVAAFAIGYLIATSYLVLRDDLIGASIARQARMQHAYEDRIAALRSQMDRIVSRQLLDQQEMEQRVAMLMARQDALAQRHDRIGPLLDRVTTGGIVPPVPMANPLKAQDHASLGFSPSLKKAPDGATGHLGADKADQTFAEISQSLAGIEQIQLARLSQITEEARESAQKIGSALASAGIHVKLDAPETDSGGPFISAAEAGAEGLLFEETVRGLDEALNQLDKARETARTAPISYPVNDHSISSRYGLRKDPILGTQAFHSGTDFRAPTGTPVLATADGIVVSAGWNGGYGRMVEVRHASGHVTRYAHLSSISVNEGETVERGDIVGKVGSSGRSTGPHLHYEVRKGDRPVDPQGFMRIGKDIDDLL